MYLPKHGRNTETFFYLPNYSAETKLISSCPLQERAPAKRDPLGGAPRSGKRAGELPAHHPAPPGHQPGILGPNSIKKWVDV